jgi:hypothetical protein
MLTSGHGPTEGSTEGPDQNYWAGGIEGKQSTRHLETGKDVPRSESLLNMAIHRAVQQHPHSSDVEARLQSVEQEVEPTYAERCMALRCLT